MPACVYNITHAHTHTHTNTLLQFVGASATVGRAIRRDLSRLDGALSLEDLAVLHTSPDPDAAAGPGPESPAGQDEPDGGPVARACLPDTLSHYFVSVKDEEAKYMTLKSMLMYACPSAPALLFVPPEISVTNLVSKLRLTGVPRAIALHHAMGFSGVDKRNATAAAAAAAVGPLAEVMD